MKDQYLASFWSFSSKEVLDRLRSSTHGLTRDEAKTRLSIYGANLIKPRKISGAASILISQFKSPIIIILFFAAGLSFFLESSIEASIILLIILFSGLLGYFQEKGAANAVEKLLLMVQISSEVMRDQEHIEIPVEYLVPGDIVKLKAGDIIPADCLILESRDLFVDEASMTGETFPVEKLSGISKKDAPISMRKNALFMGTHVVSGSAAAVIVLTGKDTEFGKISDRLKHMPPETDFERGVRRFGYFLMEVTLLLIIAIFAVNTYLARPVLESLLFSLALAVGLTPQLLPAIISVNLAHGAKRMAENRVIVKRLSSIENLGSMNVLCSDKTGTLTEGTVNLHSTLDIEGKESDNVFLYAYLNAFYETGFQNPIDNAIRNFHKPDITSFEKIDEVPYDFVRKRLSIMVSKDGTNLMITKGALLNVLDACSTAEFPDGKKVDISQVETAIRRRYEDLSVQGFRVIGIGYRYIESRSVISKDDETELTFLGFIVFYDPPKSNIEKTIDRLKNLGISMKMITGDNEFAASNTGRKVGLSTEILTGQDIRNMSDEALHKRVNDISIFAEVEPNQKERIIFALRKTGNVVGYMGDGINDASALHASDVGISVDSAVDAAKDAADIVLLEKDLSVLEEGVREGRTTFANTMKYMFMATSANFGNMFSMAGASVFLPFLPLLPKQILLTNLMTDIPEMTISTDSVDSEMVVRPEKWDIGFIRSFMVVFGILSSLFDYLTFGALLFVLNASIEQFRTGWFIASVISASIIVLVIRTRKPFFRSMPGKYLVTATLLMAAAAIVLPYFKIGRIFELSPIPLYFMIILAVIVMLYVVSAEIVKVMFYKRISIPK